MVDKLAAEVGKGEKKKYAGGDGTVGGQVHSASWAEFERSNVTFSLSTIN